jgi:hypothetical protein
VIDGHGNPMSGDAASVELYDRAVDRFVRFHPDVVDLATALVEVDRPAPMAHALMGYLHLMTTDAADLEVATAAVDALGAAGPNERERAHAAVLDAWSGGDWTGAAARLDDVLQRWPTDLLALMAGHQLDFFVGDAGSLRDRPARSWREFDADDPHAGFVRGMMAFGLEESGHYGAAEAAGLEAVEANADDVWAIHAVVHAYEMQGRVEDGIGFLTGRLADWSRGNLFTIHNWWHLALLRLEAGQHAQVLAIYDAEIHAGADPTVPIELLDASALLWRLFLDDVDTGERFSTLAEEWSQHVLAQPWYAFNDVHAAMALAGAGRLDDGHALIRRLDTWLDTAGGTNARMTAEIGLPACRALVAFAEQRYADVIAELGPIRYTLHHFGGSHAQRDVLQRTLLESALRAGRYELARGLTAERLAVRESSVYAWTQRARALQGLGDPRGAATATAMAQSYRERFAAGAG